MEKKEEEKEKEKERKGVKESYSGIFAYKNQWLETFRANCAVLTANAETYI